MKQLVIKTIKSKLLLIPVMAATLVVLGIVVHYSNIHDLVIFPDKDRHTFYFYNDKPNGGNSQILNSVISDSIIMMNYKLGNDFQSPYVGVSITPVYDSIINAKQYNQITIGVQADNTDRIGISLYIIPSGFLKKHFLNESLYHTYINITNKPTTYKIPVNQLKHPDWWEDLNQLPENDKGTLDLGKILHINIGTAYSSNNAKEKTLIISYLAFSRNNTTIFLITGLSYMGFVLLLFTFIYYFLFRKNNKSKIVVEYKPIDFVKKEDIKEIKCIAYINSNYHDSELTLEKISEATGISQRNITKVINDNYKCNFKTYINSIRINESKRFLSETDLNIGEIAFKVGFNSQSHFNRVFKNEMQVSPTEYRENHKS